MKSRLPPDAIYCDNERRIFQLLNEKYHVLDEKMNTLKGVFNNQKVAPRKNFIQENVRQLRDMQMNWHTRDEQSKIPKADKSKKVTPRVPLHVTNIHKFKDDVENALVPRKRNTKPSTAKALSTTASEPVAQSKRRPPQKANHITSNTSSALRTGHPARKGHSDDERNTAAFSSKEVSTSEGSTSLGWTSRGCQTVDPSKLDTLYSEGVIKYPSCRKPPSVIKSANSKVPTRDMALQTEDLEARLRTERRTRTNSNNSAAGDIKSVGEVPSLKSESGIKVSPTKDLASNFEGDTHIVNKLSLRAGSTSTHLRAPSHYQKGAIPKYLQERQAEWRKVAEEHQQNATDPCCPSGHVPLPDSDRKETLKMLRKSYADLVHELNMMPVKSDTLKMRNRKIELEKQLNKLEEGIKVFSRPKVYVKVGV